MDSAHALRNSPLHATRNRTATPTNGGIAGLGLRDPPKYGGARSPSRFKDGAGWSRPWKLDEARRVRRRFEDGLRRGLSSPAHVVRGAATGLLSRAKSRCVRLDFDE